MLPAPEWLVSYKTGSDYDSADRLTRLSYPDNDEVRYEYNERGLLSRIAGGPSGSILTNLAYWPSDQQRREMSRASVREASEYSVACSPDSRNAMYSEIFNQRRVRAKASGSFCLSQSTPSEVPQTSMPSGVSLRMRTFFVKDIRTSF